MHVRLVNWTAELALAAESWRDMLRERPALTTKARVMPTISSTSVNSRDGAYYER
jgi:hypothetical protein